MANTNFTTAIAPINVVAFKDVVIKAAADNEITLVERTDLGNGQAWSLKSWSKKPRISVIAYTVGTIVWQNINPQRIGISHKIASRWANAPAAK